jgi:hypothetical protein
MSEIGTRVWTRLRAFALLAAGPELPGQLPAQLPARLEIQRATDPLVTDPNSPIIGMVDPESGRYALRRPGFGRLARCARRRSAANGRYRRRSAQVRLISCPTVERRLPVARAI